MKETREHQLTQRMASDQKPLPHPYVYCDEYCINRHILLSQRFGWLLMNTHLHSENFFLVDGAI